MHDVVVSEPLVHDLERALRCDNIFRWIDFQAESLAALGNGAGYQTRFTRALLEARSVLSVESQQTLSQHACIFPVNGGFKIHYAERLPNSRQRFAIAHEIGHTFFFKAPGSTRSLSSLQGAQDPSIESLCDFFARALLLPRRRFVQRIEALAQCRLADLSLPPLHLAPMLAREFSVALQAVVRRMVFDVFSRNGAVLCLKRGGDNSATHWSSVWYAASADRREQAPTGWVIALDRRGRRVPSEIIPTTPINRTVEALMDGRLAGAATPESQFDAKKPISRRKPLQPKLAVVSRHITQPELFQSATEFALIALPAS
jgi:hypothetical protein